MNFCCWRDESERHFFLERRVAEGSSQHVWRNVKPSGKILLQSVFEMTVVRRVGPPPQLSDLTLSWRVRACRLPYRSNPQLFSDNSNIDLTTRPNTAEVINKLLGNIWQFCDINTVVVGSHIFSLHSRLSVPQADLLELWALVVWQSLAAVVLVSAAY